ncbi:MAG: ArsR/SmtB family transcription factor [Pyrinomonadaceae bacterium]
MHTDEYVEFEKLFLALADKTRLHLLALLSDGELPVGEMVDQTGESQPKVSRHLAYLRNADVVSARRDGKWIYYGIQ